MTNKRKNILIIFLFTAVIALTVSMVTVLYNSDKSISEADIQEYQDRIDLLSSQLQEEKASADDYTAVIENVCSNFLKAYYSVQHSTSQAASAETAKSYCTEELFNRISPESSGDEYTPDELDIDYSSSILIHKTYCSLSDPEEIIVSCTINKNVNDMKSSNSYYINLSVKNVNNEWLVDGFELTAVQEG